ncbi:putative gustatory receptor clone PTE01 [Suncus etruscus]|uniref:putative gustatory receptor clone PTE01 n=1 Tax=Suncus etruscus TaxID=109475 RepID=UPI0021103CB3|nr:putative gustatory receptor clone PTE01 [Suncus etruscus]
MAGEGCRRMAWASRERSLYPSHHHSPPSRADIQHTCTHFHLFSHRCLCPVDPHNRTGTVEFLLLGFSDDPQVQLLLSCLFLSMYLVTITGNLLIILVVISDSHLHIPMYFFLSNLSVADIGFTSTTVPKVIWDINTQSRIISYAGCLVQFSLFYSFVCLDSVILTVMAYDRFVAICHPLHYSVIMNPHFCYLLLLLSVGISLLDSQLHCLMISMLTFCAHVEIPHFFCDPPQLLRLACGDTSTANLLLCLIAAIFGGVPVSGIFYSYTRIVSSVMRVSSTGGRYKAFSTCGSHLSIVCLFYGTAVGVYLSYAVSHSPRNVALTSIVYSMVVPLLNPFIYSLRNKDLQRAFQKLLRRTA